MLNQEDSSKLLYAQLEFTNSPAYQLKPKLSKDGNMWCALYGENLMEGVAGFGKSPSLAFADFDTNWLKENQ